MITQNELNLLISVKNDLRNAIYQNERLMERATESHTHLCNFLKIHCRHDWLEDGERAFCQKCGVGRGEEGECKHPIWAINSRGGRDYCINCGAQKTPDRCERHQWEEKCDEGVSLLRCTRCHAWRKIEGETQV